MLSLNVHKVIGVTIKPESETKTVDYGYATRIIVIETEQGSIEVTLFSKQKLPDDDGPYMNVVV